MRYKKYLLRDDNGSVPGGWRLEDTDRMFLKALKLMVLIVSKPGL